MRSQPLLLALVPLLGLVELGLHQYFAARAPDVDDYAALGPELARRKQAGVPVVVAPAWAEPMLRKAAPAAFPLDELARPDDSGFASFLEVSLLGQSAPELADFPVQRTEQVGNFRLAWHQNPRPEPTRFDFVSALERGEVEVESERDGQRRPCPLRRRARAQTGGLHGHVAYPRSRYECWDGRIVGVTVIDDQAYRPHRCLVTTLPDEGRIWLRFGGVPATARLVGFVGFSYFLERDSTSDEAELSVSEAGQALGRQRVAGARGWSRFEVARSAAPGAIEVGVRPLRRNSGDLCFALEAR